MEYWPGVAAMMMETMTKDQRRCFFLFYEI